MAGPEAAAFNVGGSVDAMLNVEGVRHETMGPHNPIAADGIVLKATQDTAIPERSTKTRRHMHGAHKAVIAERSPSAGNKYTGPR
jgi:hypothetical protein